MYAITTRAATSASRYSLGRILDLAPSRWGKRGDCGLAIMCLLFYWAERTAVKHNADCSIGLFTFAPGFVGFNKSNVVSYPE